MLIGKWKGIFKMRRSMTTPDRLYVAGHRGNSEKYPENTIEAFREAIINGADMVETDVRLTKDRVLVLMHDETVDRTTNASGKVNSFTYDELKNVNAGTAEYFQPIPTFEELLKVLKHTDATLNLEFKEYNIGDNRENCEYCINEALRLCEAYGMKERTLCNSFDAYVLEYIDEHYHGQYLLHGFYPYTMMKNVRRNPEEYLYCACMGENTNPEHYQYLRSKDIEPWIGASVKTKEHLETCIRLGARLITTNNPETILSFLKNR